VTAPAKKSAGKDVEAFRQSHDKSYRIPRIIKESLAELGDGWEYELEFLKRSGLSVVDLATYRDQFADNWMEVRSGNRNVKRVWAGTVKFANKLREHYS
jgi:hypothetical protein